MSYLTTDAIDLPLLRSRVMRRSDGAVAVFEGVVRDHHEGKAVESILYEAYGPMAENEIGLIVRRVRNDHPGTAVAVLHRIGRVAVGETSIAIVCTSSHRSEAFAACRSVIDAIKKSVPIWKKERGPAGEEWTGWQMTDARS